VCSDLSGQQVEVVKLDLGRGGAIVVKLLEGMQGQRFLRILVRPNPYNHARACVLISAENALIVFLG